jgi:hypothetical protein
MLEIALRFGATFKTSKNQIKLTPFNKKSPVPSSKHGKSDSVSANPKAETKATASDFVVGLAAKSSGRLAPSSPALLASTTPASLSAASSSASLSAGANNGVVKFSIQGIALPGEITYDASTARLPLFVRNAFNIKELTTSIGLFVDGAEAPIKVQPQRSLCFGFESDWTNCRITSLRLVCSASGSRLDLSASAGDVAGRICIVVFREIPEPQYWNAYKDMSIDAMAAAAASMKHHVEVIQWSTKLGELVLKTPAVGRVGVLSTLSH